MGATYTAGLIGSVEDGLLGRESAIAIHLQSLSLSPVVDGRSVSGSDRDPPALAVGRC
jgi:hypothetical protein